MGRWFSYFLNRKECITIASTELKTSVTYEATGEQTVFNIPFDYLRNSFVKAKIGDDGEPMEYGTDYEVANRQITFTTAPVGMLYVYRETPTDRMVQFMEGSVLKANDMNISTLQQLHIIEENEDWMVDNSFVPNEDKSWDAKNRRIINTADPVDAQDVVTKNYMETVQSGFVQQNTLLKDEATKQANIATQKAQTATEKANTAAQQADRAQAWAESETSPDGEDDADSPTSETMSAKEWALYAKQIAENMGNPVTDVGEENGTVTVTKSDGAQSNFDIVKTINGITPTGGNVDINRKFYNSLAQLGLNYDTVTFDQIANTLPVNSTLTFYVDIVTTQPIYAPNLDIPVSGFIVVTKGVNNTVPIKFTLSPIANNATTYIGEYTTYNSYGFKGWQPIVLSVNGAKPNYTGNLTVPVDTYKAWQWSGNGITIDGFTVTFTNGFKMAIWYMLFPNQTNQLTVNFLTPFITPPCVFGSIVVANGATHLIPNVFNITATSVTCVTNNTAGATATYWVAMGYDV